ncbi:MAG TPA: hypothetical protein VEC35_25460 [Noviherbaspirillum sp.]|nr:hypothetical protein [Noviherbaspirillum sp.]
MPDYEFSVRPSYGAERSIFIREVDFARQAAKYVVDSTGQLNHDHINDLIKALEDTQGSLRLASSHRTNALRTLRKLRDSEEFAARLESICENGPPEEPAAGVVRGTLNLDPSTSVDDICARRAVVTALLGNLHQHEVGSCFATAVAITLHKECPEQVVLDMKCLLEENKMTFRDGDTTIDIPLNSLVSHHPFEIERKVRADGTCYGIFGQKTGFKPYKVHQGPGMHACLVALRIPEHRMEATVSAALKNLRKAGHPLHRISNRQILEQIAWDTHGSLSYNQRMARVRGIYWETANIQLLRTWEYTLAAFAELNNGPYSNQLQNSLLSGSVADREDLQSIAGLLDRQMMKFIESLPDEYQNLPGISHVLVGNIRTLMKERFIRKFNATINQGDRLSHGRVGGFELYYRLPSDEPSQWSRIGDPKSFQECLAHLAEDAARMCEDEVHFETESQQHHSLFRAALKELSRDLKSYIHTPEFYEHVARQMNPRNDGIHDADKLRNAILSRSTSHDEDLQSIDSFLGYQMAKFVESLPDEHRNLPGISHVLVDNIGTLVDERFIRKLNRPIDQGRNQKGFSVGGFDLYYRRRPSDEPSQWVRIESQESFQECLEHLTEDAARISDDEIHFETESQQHHNLFRAAIKELSRDLKSHIRTPEFIEHVMRKMAQHQGGTDEVDIALTENAPWKAVSGSNAYGLVRHYGAGEFNINPTPTSEGPRRFKTPHDFMVYLGYALNAIKPQLLEKATVTGLDFEVVVGNGNHAFTLSPGALQNCWYGENGEPDDFGIWTSSMLQPSANAYLNEPRSSPPLATLLRSMEKEAGISKQEMEELYRKHASSTEALDTKGGSYLLRDIRKALWDYCDQKPREEEGKLLTKVGDYLSSVFPTPALRFARTNYLTNSGSAEDIAVSRNQFTGKTELHFMDEEGGLKPVPHEYFEFGWTVYEPIRPDGEIATHMRP